jgi:hypothetical protein
MDERWVQGGQESTLPLGVQVIGYLLSVLGVLTVSGVGVVLLVVLTLPGAHSAISTELVPVAVLASLATLPVIFGVGLLTRRRWALSGTNGILITQAVVGILVMGTTRAAFPGLAFLGLVLLLVSLEGAAYLRRPSVRKTYRALAGPPPQLPARLVRAAVRLAFWWRLMGGLGLLGLAVGAGILAITVQPDDSSSMARLGTNIFRAAFQYFALVWFASGLLALWLRHNAFPAVIGAVSTLPLALYLQAGIAPVWAILFLGSVGLVLVVDVAIQAVAMPRIDL